MIAKLEGTHSWNGGAVVLNDLDVWPRFELSRITGLGSGGDIDDRRVERQGRKGETPKPALRRGKTVAYEGEIRARTLLELRRAEAALSAAFDPLTYGGLLEGQMVSAPHPGAVRRNFVVNPSAEVNVTDGGWSTGGGTTSRDTTSGPYPAGLAGFLISTAAAGNANIRHFSSRAPVAPGEVWAAAASFRPLAGTRTVRVFLDFYDAGGVRVSSYVGSNVSAPIGSYTRAIRAGVVAPAGAVSVQMIAEFVALAAESVFIDALWLGKVAAAGNAPPDYFDGDTPGARWEGLPHASVSRLPDTDRFFKARPLSCMISEEQATNDWRRDFAITLRLSDPRVYVPDESSYSTAAPSASGGSNLPATLPHTIPGSNSAAGQVVVNNTGTTDTDPIIELYGPGRHPLIANDTLGVQLQFVDLDLGTSGVPVVIDFSARTVTQDGADLSALLDLQLSDWWDWGRVGLAPDDNTIRFRADGLASPGKAVVRYYPADAA